MIADELAAKIKKSPTLCQHPHASQQNKTYNNYSHAKKH
ncbi:hypothetical protein UYSO10_2861 [Kosakonia radicincitans]|nr:hypothetical protein UYSO10_2861 [Kosakonia radicincitans]